MPTQALPPVQKDGIATGTSSHTPHWLSAQPGAHRAWPSGKRSLLLQGPQGHPRLPLLSHHPGEPGKAMSGFTRFAVGKQPGQAGQPMMEG